MDAAVDSPRIHHDLFAHLALPRTFLRDPAPIMGILASPEGGQFLSGMWQVLEPELEPHQRLEPRGLSLDHYALAGEIFVAVVTMPPANRHREALFVAMIARFGAQPLARCLSLELVGPPGPHAPTLLCEWTVEGRGRVLDEDGCAPELSAFIDAVERILTAAPA